MAEVISKIEVQMKYVCPECGEYVDYISYCIINGIEKYKHKCPHCNKELFLNKIFPYIERIIK